jgi:hypothetical protein
MDLLSTRTYDAQPEGRFLQMPENLLSSHVVAISLRDDLFDLLLHKSAYGNSVFRSDDLCASNRGLVELYRQISSAHARILRGARKPRAKVELIGIYAARCVSHKHRFDRRGRRGEWQ